MAEVAVFLYTSIPISELCSSLILAYTALGLKFKLLSIILLLLVSTFLTLLPVSKSETSYCLWLLGLQCNDNSFFFIDCDSDVIRDCNSGVIRDGDLFLLSFYSSAAVYCNRTGYFFLIKIFSEVGKLCFLFRLIERWEIFTLCSLKSSTLCLKCVLQFYWSSVEPLRWLGENLFVTDFDDLTKLSILVYFRLLC